VFPAVGSRVSAITAPGGVVAGCVRNDAVPVLSTVNPPTARGASWPTITHAS